MRPNVVRELSNGVRELAALQPGAFPYLGETSGYLLTLNLDDRFAWGLEVILDGLERRLAADQA